MNDGIKAKALKPIDSNVPIIKLKTAFFLFSLGIA